MQRKRITSRIYWKDGNDASIKGDRGTRVATGEAGPIVPHGPKGVRGDIGPSGGTGVKGDRHAVGPPGPKGERGVAGV